MTTFVFYAVCIVILVVRVTVQSWPLLSFTLYLSSFYQSSCCPSHSPVMTTFVVVAVFILLVTFVIPIGSDAIIRGTGDPGGCCCVACWSRLAVIILRGSWISPSDAVAMKILWKWVFGHQNTLTTTFVLIFWRFGNEFEQGSWECGHRSCWCGHKSTGSMNIPTTSSIPCGNNLHTFELVMAPTLEAHAFLRCHQCQGRLSQPVCFWSILWSRGRIRVAVCELDAFHQGMTTRYTERQLCRIVLEGRCQKEHITWPPKVGTVRKPSKGRNCPKP